jgi:hypothetical protein
VESDETPHGRRPENDRGAAASGQRPRLLRRAVGWLGYLVYLAAFMTAVSWVLHYRWLRANLPEDFRPTQQIPHVDAADLVQIGGLKKPAKRRSSFANFSPVKPPGVMRIGCFGDSYTWGTEVADGNDFPALLKKRLRALGRRRTEVLNFGTPGFGLHQTYLLWDRVGREFDLDRVVLLSMARYWAFRDTSFTFWNPPAKKLGFHARYVLDDGNLRLVEVIGDTEEQRYTDYLRFIPRMRYALYDRKAPALLRAWLPSSRRPVNPFYYRDEPVGQEARKTYRILLERLASGAPSFTLVDGTGELAAIAGDLDPPPRRVVRLPTDLGFPYIAPRNHFSPWGNRLVADTVLHSMGVGGAPRVLSISDLAQDLPAVTSHTSLRRATSIGIDLGDRHVGSFYQYRRKAPMPKKRVEKFPAQDRTVIAIPLGDTVDAIFLPWQSAASADTIRVTVEADGKSVPIGGVAADIGGPSLGLIRLDLCPHPKFREIAGLASGAQCRTLRSSSQALPPGRRLRILVDDTPLALAIVGQKPAAVAAIVPLKRYFLIRGDGEPRPEVETLDDGGLIFLTLGRAGGGRDRIPLAQWRWKAR